MLAILEALLAGSWRFDGRRDWAFGVGCVESNPARL